MAWIQLWSEAQGPQHLGLWSPGDISQALEEEASGGIGCPHPSWHAHSSGVPVGFVWWCPPCAPRIPAAPGVCQGSVQLWGTGSSWWELSPSPGTSPPLASQSLLPSGDSCSLLISGGELLKSWDYKHKCASKTESVLSDSFPTSCKQAWLIFWLKKGIHPGSQQTPRPWAKRGKEAECTIVGKAEDFCDRGKIIRSRGILEKSICVSFSMPCL
ncbi:hypothetical protein Nmel_012124 [Mimus melanotis]